MSELFETLSKLSQSQDVREHILVYSSDAFVIMHEIERLQGECDTKDGTIFKLAIDGGNLVEQISALQSQVKELIKAGNRLGDYNLSTGDLTDWDDLVAKIQPSEVK